MRFWGFVCDYGRNICNSQFCGRSMQERNLTALLTFIGQRRSSSPDIQLELGVFEPV